MPETERSSVITLRVPRNLERRIERAARRRRKTKSAVLREALQSAFGDGPESDPAREARRQSLLASGRASEADALEFVQAAADDEGWR